MGRVTGTLSLCGGQCGLMSQSGHVSDVSGGNLFLQNIRALWCPHLNLDRWTQSPLLSSTMNSWSYHYDIFIEHQVKLLNSKKNQIHIYTRNYDCSMPNYLQINSKSLLMQRFFIQMKNEQFIFLSSKIKFLFAVTCRNCLYNIRKLSLNLYTQ